jgi:predicted glycosyltransferase
MTKAIETFVIFQALTGIGHLARASAVAQAMTSISRVTLFSGGRPAEGYPFPSGVDFVQLPASYRDKATDGFAMPVDPRLTLAEVEHMRSELLVERYLRIRPAIVIVEYFPFSPRRFGKTLDKLFVTIRKEKQKPVVICSVRTYPRRWDDNTDPAWINEQLRQNFSGVLHHADARLFPLTSLGPFIQSALSGIPVWQTGFVRRQPLRMDDCDASRGLLLTVGGGSALGAKLLKRWIDAAKSGSRNLLPVNAVCGPWMGADDRAAVRAKQDVNITVHDRVADMDELIRSSRGVVCMGGYNTLVEALSLRKPVLAFPDSDRGDQAFQVDALHAQGMLLKGDRSASEPAIAALMNELLKFRAQHTIDCNGAERSVEIVAQLLRAA